MTIHPRLVECRLSVAAATRHDTIAYNADGAEKCRSIGHGRTTLFSRITVTPLLLMVTFNGPLIGYELVDIPSHKACRAIKRDRYDDPVM